MKITIGASTGYFYMDGILSIIEQEKILRESKADGFEINLGPNPQQRIELLLRPEEFGNFDHKFLHLGYDKKLTLEEQLNFIKQIIDKHKISMAVIHPDVVSDEYYEKAILYKIPLAIENMDKAKEKGFLLSELEKLANTYNLNFVLDIQHAYEHDHEMRYAQDLFEIVFSKLSHIHVSGETKNNIHSLVYKADNAAKIINFTNKILSKINLPIIIEGEYKTNKELKDEIEFLRKELDIN